MSDPRAIIWTERASADLEIVIRKYIARRNSQAAGQIGRGIFDRIEILIENPEAGSCPDELGDQGWPAAMGEADLETPLEEDW